MSITIKNPFDAHLHLRDGEMLTKVTPYSSNVFSGAIIMPNTIPPLTDSSMVQSYRERIIEASNSTNFTPCMTLFFHKELDYEKLKEAKPYITAVKLYPAGITTNSEGGINGDSIHSYFPVFEAMQSLDIPLCVHGETNDFVMDREKNFGSIYQTLAQNFPHLTIIMEHITDRHSIELLDKYPNLHASITLHHLLIDLDTVAGWALQPHLFCKPLAKRPEDRHALANAALSGHPKIMFGSDSAPHPRDKKECLGCAAGVFSAPVILPALAHFFENHNALHNLQSFVSDNAINIYKLNLPTKNITLEKKSWTVPDEYNGIIPFMYGQEMAYQITNTQT